MTDPEAFQRELRATNEGMEHYAARHPDARGIAHGRRHRDHKDGSEKEDGAEKGDEWAINLQAVQTHGFRPLFRAVSVLLPTIPRIVIRSATYGRNRTERQPTRVHPRAFRGNRTVPARPGFEAILAGSCACDTKVRLSLLPVWDEICTRMDIRRTRWAGSSGSVDGVADFPASATWPRSIPPHGPFVGPSHCCAQMLLFWAELF